MGSSEWECWLHSGGGGSSPSSDASGVGERLDLRSQSTAEGGTEDSLKQILFDSPTHHDLQANPHAAYLFAEAGSSTKGKRLFLSKLREETDSERLAQFRRGHHGSEATERHLVFFKMDKVLPLIGAGEGE